jgi:hypothetical protein
MLVMHIYPSWAAWYLFGYSITIYFLV